MTRYFEVKVTNCGNCQRADFSGFGECNEEYERTANFADSHRVFTENRNQLTPSCPMWDKTKESETK